MKKRCPWVPLQNELYVKYHDSEWGKPVHNDRILFEFLSLEGAQAGLSWITILRRRKGYKKAFFNFNVKKVSKMAKKDVSRLVKDESIIRNRAKIESVIHNAKLFIDVQKEFGSFSNYLWGFTKGKVVRNRLKEVKDYVTKTELSDEVSVDLKERGFKFVGSVSIYAYLQSIGIVNDHTVDCDFR